MQIKAFTAGYDNLPITVKELSNKPPSLQENQSSKFSTVKLLPQFVTTTAYTIIPRSFTMKEDTVTLSSLREQSILRAAASTFKVSKNEDGTIWVDPASEDTPEQALAKKRASGGDMAINWNMVDMNLSWHSMERFETLDEIGSIIDYAASEYAQYKTRIEQSFTGKEQAAELEKLNQLFSSRIDQQADRFAATVGGFLEDNGVSGQRAAIKNSILDIFEQRKTDYLNFIKENDNYAGVKGTIDEWLVTSGDFMGEQLRYAFNSKHPEMNIISKDGYTVDDLAAAGAVVKATRNINSSGELNGHSEEELGVKLGLAAMKYKLIIGNFSMSDGMRAKLDKAFNGFIDNQIDQSIKYLEEHRKDPFVQFKEAYALNYNKQIVLDIIKSMVEDLESDDFNAALKSDMNTTLAMYSNKMKNGQTSGLSRYSSVYSSWTKDNYAADWNNFVRNLPSSANMSRYLLNDSLSFIDVKV